MKQTATVQASKTGLYINIPKKIAEKMDLKKGEIALIEFVDKDTMQIKIIEE